MVDCEIGRIRKFVLIVVVGPASLEIVGLGFIDPLCAQKFLFVRRKFFEPLMKMARVIGVCGPSFFFAAQEIVFAVFRQKSRERKGLSKVSRRLSRFFSAKCA